MKKILISVLFLLIIITTMSVSAQSIIEIELPELKRSSEELILKQLSFKNGDIYSANEIELSQRRLLNSDLFNPFTLKVNSEKTAKENYQIFINAEESGIFMIHPWEFTIRKTVGLLGESFEQKIRNPAGNGLSYLFDFDWSDDSHNQYGLEYIGEKGRVYTLKFRNFDRDLEFNNTSYQSEGAFYQVNLETLPSLKINNIYSLKFQENDYIINNDIQKQKYLIPAYTFNYENHFKFEIELSRAFSLNDNYDDFNSLKFNYNKRYNLTESSIIITDLKGGALSKDTPFNYQFTAGSFSKNDGGIPIRGQDYEFAGTKYIKNTIEYQKELWRRDLWGVIFIDSAKIAESNEELGDIDWENDAGIGLIYYSFLGPIRADIAYDNLDSEAEFNIGFGSSF